MKKVRKSVSDKVLKGGQLGSSFIRHLGSEWKPLVETQNQILKFSKGETIFHQGDPVLGMHCINSGKVKIVMSYEPNGEHILRLANDGDIVGLRGVGGDEVYPVSGIALTDCTLSFLPITVFTSILKTNNQFCYYFMNVLAGELRNAERRNKDLARLEMLERIANALLYNLEVFGVQQGEAGLLSFTLSRKDYSAMVGTTYETTIRMLAELEMKKLIRLEGKEIRILNINGLKKLVK